MLLLRTMTSATTHGMVWLVVACSTVWTSGTIAATATVCLRSSTLSAKLATVRPFRFANITMASRRRPKRFRRSTPMVFRSSPMVSISSVTVWKKIKWKLSSSVLLLKRLSPITAQSTSATNALKAHLSTMAKSSFREASGLNGAPLASPIMKSFRLLTTPVG
ncbi:hypothetical protein SmphiM12_104 [Sinorhizobium phage phiM12]|uniref:Uncharacterized protein n=1 Tax=Sinorhizobium phage phiM12 TaxID=1357423 RepID=S5M6Q4_9CAUD|nr:hypothetical protein AB690_gp085 [Sinorhizobium phage phiM12]AGR47736.1 hypothetical protein SmphiM12_104 [Sinorhizobium phage phiM12]